MPYKVTEINPSRSALIIVDMENDFVAEGAPLRAKMAPAVVPPLKRALAHARKTGMRVIFTTHAHRRDGCDMGVFGRSKPPIVEGKALVDGEKGIEIYDELKPLPNEVVIKKRRYSAFYGTDLDIVLRSSGMEAVIITGVTTENCCHATARDALFHNYGVIFLSDATGTFDYPDMGYGAMSAAEVHRASLVILAMGTAHVMTVDEMITLTTVAKEAGPAAQSRDSLLTDALSRTA
jgi:ureidoacrylate peracid hydrolase